MASRHSSLKRIGEEGFRMIDQATEEKQRCLYQPTKSTVHYLQPPPVAQVHRIITPPPSPQINYTPPRGSAGHPHLSPAPVATREQASKGVMDCYEAARRYRGMVVTDYYPNKMVMTQRNNKAF
uniref:Uncharacterized protein n=1 Tax=Kalanchoe fedtschenkoi TaxID=63787 RepID=A0A7N0UEH1_KALFE